MKLFTKGLLAIVAAAAFAGYSTADAQVTYTVGGEAASSGGLTGLGAGKTVIVVNNGSDSLQLSSNGDFTFATPLSSGSSYSVTIAVQPSGQLCSVSNGYGTVNANVANVSVNCVTTYTVGGSVTGLTVSGLVLKLNNSATKIIASGAGSYSFSTSLPSGTAYSVSVGIQPAGYSCSVANGTGTISGNVTNANVSCAKTYTVGGSVSGLTATGLILKLNGTGTKIISNGAGSYVFSTTLTSGTSYVVAIQSQPSGLTCSLSGNSSGTIGTANVVDANVSCVPATYTIGGNISGLIGSVTLLNNGGNALTVSANGSFTFTAALNNGAAYNVTVGSQPTGQTCSFTNGSGNITGTNVTNVSVTCATNTYTVSGSVSGNTGTVTLTNNGVDQQTVSTVNGNFTFSPQNYGTNWSVAATGPVSQTCTVSGNGTGSNITANVTNVVVTCTTKTFTVSGTVSGNSGTVSLTNNGTDQQTVTSTGVGPFAFSFSPQNYGTNWSVAVTSPGGQTCLISNPSGSNITANVTNVVVTCQNTTYTVGGNVTGLGTGLTVTLLDNGTDSLPVNASSPGFTFNTPLASGASYNVTVGTQPTGQTCTVNAGTGTGTISNSNVNTVVVTCVNSGTALDATIILGKPTNNSVSMNLFTPDQNGTVSVSYGTTSGSYSNTTTPVTLAIATPLMINLTGLNTDSQYYYKLNFQPSSGNASQTPEYQFHTARNIGQSFTFTIQADSHLDGNSSFNNQTDCVPDVYLQTLNNIAGDKPDFHIDVGDTFMTEKFWTYGCLGNQTITPPQFDPTNPTSQDPANTRAQVQARYQWELPHFGSIAKSIPLFLVNGNHDAELGWLSCSLTGGGVCLPYWAAEARTQYYNNPSPNSFYTGEAPTTILSVSKASAYYSWKWGDALFIALDPFWNSNTTSSGDIWNMSLGVTQYKWLQSTLAANAGMKYKFIFMHNLVGGVPNINSNNTNGLPDVDATTAHAALAAYTNGSSTTLYVLSTSYCTTTSTSAPYSASGKCPSSSTMQVGDVLTGPNIMGSPKIQSIVSGGPNGALFTVTVDVAQNLPSSNSPATPANNCLGNTGCIIFSGGTINTGGAMRGGAEAAIYGEWGGKNYDGVTSGFNTKRPASSGWTQADGVTQGLPIHNMLVQYGVTAVFHGHDHLYADQTRDGIRYQEVAQPSAKYQSNPNYATLGAQGGYQSCVNVLNPTCDSSSGYERVTVDPINGVTAQYVKTFLLQSQGTNKSVAQSWNVPAPNTATYTVSGNVSGLGSGKTVTLTNNGSDSIVVTGSGTSNDAFTFGSPLLNNASYSVTVTGQPAAQNCTVQSGGSGTINNASVTNVIINCVNIITYTVGGSVTGNTGSITLTNTVGGVVVDSKTLTSPGGFTFAAQNAGTSWSVAVASSPPGQTCTLTNASGSNISANITNVSVSCAATTYSIGYTVTGNLGNRSITLTLNGSESKTQTSTGTGTFTTKLASGATYSVTPISQVSTSTGRTCIVTNGAGVVQGSAVNVTVNCASTIASSYYVSGTASGVTGLLTLYLNGNTISTSVPAGGTGFAFPAQLTSGTAYAISASSATQKCTVTNGSGTMPAANVTNVSVSCVNAYSVGGSVSGYSSSFSLLNTVTNGSIPADNFTDTVNVTGSTFSFTKLLVNSDNYNVSVSAQPANQLCLVLNPSGAISSASISSVSVVCQNYTTVNVVVSKMPNPSTACGTLVLNDGTESLSPCSATTSTVANGSYAFATQLAPGTAYNVAISSNTTGRACVVTNGKGTAIIGTDVTVSVVCPSSSAGSKYYVSGTVNGLTGPNMSISQGGTTNTVAETVSLNPGGTNFAFSTPINGNSTYTNLLTVAHQPDGQICTISNNGTVSVTNANVTNIVITCVSSYTVGGAVTGLGTGLSLTLQNNGGDALTLSANGAYTFATAIASGSAYSVTVSSQPLNQTCLVTNPSGSVGSANVTNVAVNCTTTSFTIGGTVTGLGNSTLVLLNNGGDNLTLNSDGLFQFATALVSGSYNVTVGTQPTGLTCTVSNGSGTLSGQNVTSVTVSCVNNTNCSPAANAVPPASDPFWNIYSSPTDPDADSTPAVTTELPNPFGACLGGP